MERGGGQWQGASQWFSYSRRGPHPAVGVTRSVEGYASHWSCSTSVQCVIVLLFLIIHLFVLYVPALGWGYRGMKETQDKVSPYSSQLGRGLPRLETHVLSRFSPKQKQKQNSWPLHSSMLFGPLRSFGTHVAYLESHALRA